MSQSSSGSPHSRLIVRWFSISLVTSAILLIAFVAYERRPDPPFEIKASVTTVTDRAAHISLTTSDALFVYLLYETADTTTYALSPRRADGPHGRLPAGVHELTAEPLPEAKGNLVMIASRRPVWWIDEAIHKLPRSAVAPVLEASLFAGVPVPEDSSSPGESLGDAAGPTRLARPLEEGAVTVQGVWIRRTEIEPTAGL